MQIVIQMASHFIFPVLRNANGQSPNSAIWGARPGNLRKDGIRIAPLFINPRFFGKAEKLG